MKFMVDKKPLWIGRGYEVRIVSSSTAVETCGGKSCCAPFYVEPLVAKYIDKEHEGMIIPPAFELDEASAQQLCDALWEAGVRPTNGEGSTGQLAATQAHLADMKTLAFHVLKVKS